MKVSIVIPAYNEELTLEGVIRKINQVQLAEGIVKEIVVVNDGSTDNTAGVLNQFANDKVVKIFHQECNRGKTAALVRGIENATGDIVLIQDADLEYDPSDYPKLIGPILRGETSVVYGSRFKGTIKGMTIVNRTANVFSNIVFNILYGTNITDINTCYKVFKKEVLKGVTIVSKNFTFETEITVKMIRRGVKIVEVPIDYTARSDRQGKKIRWGTALEMFWGMIKYRSERGGS